MNAADLSLVDYVLGLLPESDRRRIERDRLVRPSLARRIGELEGFVNAPGPLPIRDPSPEAADVFVRAMRQIVGAAPTDPWVEVSPGLFQRRLWNERSHLVRCRSGALIPAHDHPSDELFLVLDGEVAIGDRRYETGATERSPRGSHHVEGRALEECVVLVQLARPVS